MPVRLKLHKLKVQLDNILVHEGDTEGDLESWKRVKGKGVAEEGDEEMGFEVVSELRAKLLLVRSSEGSRPDP